MSTHAGPISLDVDLRMELPGFASKMTELDSYGLVDEDIRIPAASQLLN